MPICGNDCIYKAVRGEYVMILKKLHIYNFKLFEDIELQFKPGFNLTYCATSNRLCENL